MFSVDKVRGHGLLYGQKEREHVPIMIVGTFIVVPANVLVNTKNT